MNWIDGIPIRFAVAAALTFGLAPFLPMPHVVEKLISLRRGTLRRSVDIIDLVMHGIPWVIVMLKVVRELTLRR